MTPIGERRLNIAHVLTGEVRIRRMGASPGQGSRIALLSAEGAAVSNSLFNVFSPQTLKLMDMLCKSIENDYIEHLQVPEGLEDMPPEEDPEDSEVRFG